MLNHDNIVFFFHILLIKLFNEGKFKVIKYHQKFCLTDSYYQFTDANFPCCFSDLVIVSTSTSSSLVWYDLGQALPLRNITYGNGVGQSLFVFEDGTVYWVIYDVSNGNYMILCTSPIGETRDLGIIYNQEILVVVSRLYIFVLVKDSSRIDIYSRRTLAKNGELQIAQNVNEFTLALGKFVMTEVTIKLEICVLRWF